LPTVHVHHIDLETGRYVHVADIACPIRPTKPGAPNDPTRDPDLEALEYAWERTQNIDGSWSRAGVIEGPDGSPTLNRDYHPNIVRIAALPVHDGRTYGLRSSMVGDRWSRSSASRRSPREVSPVHQRRLGT
jgi:hypothetical protein